ncbi:J domain-containing protein [Candidatus Neomicrothrix sp.]|jgi:molecular chaperone DnaJ|uniref:J domain-containing protein n=1 Tax=Candidatus Neomicrothrix sp. TaxID=2719034 RepID=UPI001B6113EA|nr:J domain-containing protein [Candidatus Microthrix sp.]MBP7595594.1 J domain-containing protein [Candidatus Microthrix sp.]HMS49160.1 J domain-containing protein [Candidatus Microthrix sp.]
MAQITEDPYEVLGVHREATHIEIKAAYRKAARDSHPDANPDDPHAEARFKSVAVAYEILSDGEKRENYDRFGSVDGGAGMADGMGGLSDLFDAFFGGGGGSGFGAGFGGGATRGRTGPQRGPDLETNLRIPFDQAVFGGAHDVTVRTAVACETCEATGAAPGTGPKTCETCGGQGQVQSVRRSILGQMVTASPCPTCQGSGELIPSPCSKCDGDGRIVEEATLTVEVPAGVDDGSTLRLTGRGAVGARGGPAGDLYVHLNVSGHSELVRDGTTLHIEVPVSVAQATLGTQLEVDTLDGAHELTVPAGTQSGWEHRFRGLGVPRLDGRGRDRGRGDLIAHVSVHTPTDLSHEQEELLRRFAELREEAVTPPKTGLGKKIRSAFK